MQEALEQIEKCGYALELEADGYDKIVKVAVVSDRKKARGRGDRAWREHCGCPV